MVKIKKKRSSVLSRAIKNVAKIVEKQEKKEIEDKKPEEKVFKSTRGVIYIGHIPYGFFEDEMKEYFEQFGTVTKVRVARSKKTGKSRGYGYIEFESPEVAKIAADTMNNYLMCGRLLKTTYIPPERQHKGFFGGKPWTSKIYPKVSNRMKELKKLDNPITERKYKKNVRRSLRNVSAIEEKLRKAGITIKLKPVGAP